MSLNDCLRKNASALGEIPLTPLDCNNGYVSELPQMDFDSAMKKEARNAGRNEQDVVTVVFVVRRPGCVACREHGLQLSDLVMEFANVSLWAIVKETGVEEQGILSFYKDFFCFPVYKDEKWMTYKAMGSRTLGLFNVIRRCMSAHRRWTDKGIPNRLKGGDIWMQGGILFFKRGELRYAYEEDYGNEFDLADIRAAIQRLQVEDEACSATCSDTSEDSFDFWPIRSEI